MIISASVSMATGSEVKEEHLAEVRISGHWSDHMHVRLTGDFKLVPSVSVWVSGLCPVMDWESDSSPRFLPELISGSPTSHPHRWSPAERVETRLHYLKV